MQKWPSAEELRPFRGQWVGLFDGNIVVCSPDIVDLVTKSRILRVELDAMFRVPADE